MTSQAVARRYAQALYQVAEQHGTVEAVDRDLSAFRELLDNHAELDAVVASPLVLPRKKGELIRALLAAMPGTSSEVTRLLGLLADRDRLGALRAIADAYRTRVMAADRIISGEVVTAVPLAAPQKQRLTEALGRATGHQVNLTDRVDSTIVGGVVAKIGSLVFDGSAARQIERLRQALVADV